jgi:hypothetical protein
MEKNKTEDKIVNIKVGMIDLPKIDVSKFIGKKSKIVSANVHEGTFGLYVKVLTGVLETVGQTEIRASKILGLQTDENGVHGYGEGTKLDLFLKKYKCKEVKDLIGKEVILQTTTSKDNVDYLTFN